MVNTAIVGAGPYGLSIAAHLRALQIPFRIFGRPMDSWQSHMPAGMLLKSEGSASNLFDPEGRCTLRSYCVANGIPYADRAAPVSLETFTAYGVAFQQAMVPELDAREVMNISRAAGGFALRLDGGEVVRARRVVLAVGLTHFPYIPELLQHLSPERLSHSFQHHELGAYRGRRVIVLGGGASAIDLAALLRDAGAAVEIVTRRPELRFTGKPSDALPSLWQRVRHPESPLGAGWPAYVFANAPMVFRFLPDRLRIDLVRRVLGPRGGWATKEKVIGRVALTLGHSVAGARVRNSSLELQLHGYDGREHALTADHLISATGFRVDVDRLSFLDAELRSRVKVIAGCPVLSGGFESSIPNVFFVGLASALSFGPVMRFACGAGFTAQRVAETILSASRKEAPIVSIPRTLDASGASTAL